MDFFKSERLGELSPLHRLLFVGLWTLADRNGRLEDRPRRIKAEVFPYDDCDVSAMLQDLAHGPDPMIRRYVVDDIGYIAVVKFAKHQRPHVSEPAGVIPPPDGTRTEPVRNPDGVVATLGREGKGKEGNGGGEAAVAAMPDVLRDLWNAGCGTLPQCIELGTERRRHAQQRLKDRPLEQWVSVVARIRESAFCNGQNDRGWRATFDWLIRPDTAAKVLEGKYDSAKRVQQPPADPIESGVRRLCELSGLSEHAIREWFIGTKLDGTRLIVPELDARDWITKHYLNQLTKAHGGALEVA